MSRATGERLRAQRLEFPLSPRVAAERLNALPSGKAPKLITKSAHQIMVSVHGCSSPSPEPHIDIGEKIKAKRKAKLLAKQSQMRPANNEKDDDDDDDDDDEEYEDDEEG